MTAAVPWNSWYGVTRPQTPDRPLSHIENEDEEDEGQGEEKEEGS